MLIKMDKRIDDLRQNIQRVKTYRGDPKEEIKRIEKEEERKVMENETYTYSYEEIPSENTDNSKYKTSASMRKQIIQ